jgi:hypothetical protein
VEKRRLVTNAGQSLMLLSTEPEGQDFWLRPGESLEMRAEVKSELGDFELVEEPEGLSAYPSEGMGYISVWANDTLLQCGYQRPKR